LDEGATALLLAANDGNTEVVKALLDAGANPSSRNLINITPVELAISNGHFAVLKLLCRDIQLQREPRTSEGLPLLNYAVQCGQLSCVTHLLHRGANVNAVFENGFTALHSAAEVGNKDIFGMLIQNKACISAVSSKGSILHHAAHRNHVRMILEHPKCKDEFSPASGKNLINQRNKFHQTALQITSGAGFADSVQVLLENGAHTEEESCCQLSSQQLASARGNLPDGYTSNEEKYTPLYLSSKNGHLEAVKILLKFGANINAKSLDGRTPLLIATIEERFQVVQYLLEQKADPYIGADGNLLPLHEAAIRGNLDLLKLLVPYYESIFVEDAIHQTPLDYARLHGNVEIQKYLEEIETNTGMLEYLKTFLEFLD
jgi:ankyrin repeat protein